MHTAGGLKLSWGGDISQGCYLRTEMATEIWAGMGRYIFLCHVSLEPPGLGLVNDKAVTSQRQSWIKYKYGNYFQTHFSKSRFLNLDVTGYANDAEKEHQAVPVALLGAHCSTSSGCAYNSRATGSA